MQFNSLRCEFLGKVIIESEIVKNRLNESLKNKYNYEKSTFLAHKIFGAIGELIYCYL